MAGGLDFWVSDLIPNAAYSTRKGGVSSGPFSSLNLGRRTEDAEENIRENRRTVSEALGISDEWLSVRQVHGAEVFDASAGLPAGGAPEADAIFDTGPGAPLAVVTADCLPIVLSGPSFRGVVHAGWRGLCAGIIDAALGRLSDRATPLSASIGPSIGACHYRVGAEVVDAFHSRYPNAPDFARHVGGHLHFDLRAAGRWVLRQWGAQVEPEDPPCTFCDPSFFSHRRDGVCGRQAVVLW